MVGCGVRCEPLTGRWAVGPGMLLAACAARLPTPGRGSYFGMQVAVSQAHARTVRLPPAVEAPIHWPSAIAGLVLAIAVVVGVSWLASTRQSEHRLTVRAAPIVPTQPEPAAAAGQTAQAPAPTVAPTPIPPPAQAASASAADRLKVANTRGLGVNLRARAGEQAARLKTLPEGTLLDLVGPDERADGSVWKNVREPGGSEGWVSASYVSAAGR